MRKLILATAIILASTAAHAGTTRGLISLASSDTVETTSVEQAKPADQAKPVEQAPVVQPTAAKSTDAKPVDAQRVDEKPRHKTRRVSDRGWTERRIRAELARYGIY